jgi:hypothetical protein
VIDDFQSYENAVAPARPAARLVRHISRALRAQFWLEDDEADRAAILRETFGHAADRTASRIPSAQAREANEGDDQVDLVLRAGWQRKDAEQLEIDWHLEPGVRDPETLLRQYSDLMMGRRSQPRLRRGTSRRTAAFGSGLPDAWHS